jgi:hypothetical protein
MPQRTHSTLHILSLPPSLPPSLPSSLPLRIARLFEGSVPPPPLPKLPPLTRRMGREEEANERRMGREEEVVEACVWGERRREKEGDRWIER